MPHLAPPTLTAAEQETILRVTAANVRDHTIISMALGTGLRLAELVGLDVGDVFAPDGTPRVRVRIRPEIAKGGRAGGGLSGAALTTDATEPIKRRNRCGR
ncbi:MAG: tyrosine-type recombinase/integrase [Acidobacteriia bacterium]|nr:tyrosine-type recombinase/integrase [Terriglobia bacterium]